MFQKFGVIRQEKFLIRDVFDKLILAIFEPHHVACNISCEKSNWWGWEKKGSFTERMVQWSSRGWKSQDQDHESWRRLVKAVMESRKMYLKWQNRPKITRNYPTYEARGTFKIDFFSSSWSNRMGRHILRMFRVPGPSKLTNKSLPHYAIPSPL